MTSLELGVSVAYAQSTSTWHYRTLLAGIEDFNSRVSLGEE